MKLTKAQEQKGYRHALALIKEKSKEYICPALYDYALSLRNKIGPVTAEDLPGMFPKFWALKPSRTPLEIESGKKSYGRKDPWFADREERVRVLRSLTKAASK